MPGTSSEGPSRSQAWVSRVLRGFEHVVMLGLITLLMVIVLIATVELGYLVLQDLSTVRGLVLDVEEMFALFGFFLLVLIGMELLVTLKAFLYDRIIHVEIVLEVSLIAVAQKIIVLNTSQLNTPLIFGLATLVLALAVAFVLVRMARRPPSGRAG